MDSSRTHLLTALHVFKHTLNEELIRSVHVYRLENGKNEEVEREFVFSRDGGYMEMVAHPLFQLQTFRVWELFDGRVIGLWVCIFSFDAARASRVLHIPSILSISGNAKLKLIPTLTNDLEMIFQLSCRKGNNKRSLFPPKKMCEGNNYHHSKRTLPVLDQDLNCLPYPVAMSELSENQHTDQRTPGIVVLKKTRAATKHISRISLEDLAKYFDLPIAEASRNLKVGVTVLKRKCREFGIARWPHRKIKSLDSLIHDLQGEAERQQQESKAAAMAVAKRQRMLEREKESIERKPLTEIQSETKRFRQDVFKRRHRARVRKNRGQSISPNLEHQ